MAEFINDAIIFIRNYIQMYMTDPPHLYGQKRSLVRRIGSALPLKSVPRIRIPLKIRESFVSSLMKKRLNFEDSQMAERLSNPPTSTPLPKPDFLLDVYERTRKHSPKMLFSQGEEISSLKQKVQMLEDLINKILVAQSMASQAMSANLHSETSDVSFINPQPRNGPPPPPPPPPPPLPALVHSQNKLVISKSNFNHLKENSKPSRPSMGEVLKDLNKIKLRHVERSPGGGPIKRQTAPTSPAGCLAAVLRRRFEAIQMKADENMEDDYDSNDSMNSIQSFKVEACH